MGMWYRAAIIISLQLGIFQTTKERPRRRTHVTRALIVTLMLTAFPFCVLAQHQHANSSSTSSSLVSDSDADMIDGAQHPELIPDSDAYRLYLVAVSEMPNPTAEQRNRQLAHLGKIGLADNDHQSLVAVLSAFNVQYAGLIARYNASAEAALRVGATADIKSFLVERDDLVQGTRDRLRNLLTPQGMARLDARVQNEKTKMRVAAKERQ